MGMDLITLEVLRNKFDVIADEMEITLLKSAYSSIVKEGMDASAAPPRAAIRFGTPKK